MATQVAIWYIINSFQYFQEKNLDSYIKKRVLIQASTFFCPSECSIFLRDSIILFFYYIKIWVTWFWSQNIYISYWVGKVCLVSVTNEAVGSFTVTWQIESLSCKTCDVALRPTILPRFLLSHTHALTPMPVCASVPLHVGAGLGSMPADALRVEMAEA